MTPFCKIICLPAFNKTEKSYTKKIELDSKVKLEAKSPKPLKFHIHQLKHILGIDSLKP